MWKYYALLSALFAALTAVFAKIGLSARQSSCLSLGNRSCRKPYCWGERHQRTYMDIPYSVRCCHRSLVAVLLQGIAGGDVSRVAPIDKLSVVITICLSFLFLKEPASLRVIIGALLITGGSIVMLIK